ncbi:hypothetical protein ACFU99_33300 [Streptomyces sp. NPDC057654]|uniref:hypothetical protein n=1 Tax=Streptomyces sp. NPDC057654 TaxID=3346196 RepID=UPI0036C24B6C
MSQVCNKALQLSQQALSDKKRLAQHAGAELLAAASDLFKALELAEHEDATTTAAVYVASAEKRLRHADELLAEVGAILATGELTEETRDWYRNLDYDRLYRTGVELGMTSRGAELWSEITEVTVAQGPTGVCRALRDRVLATASLMAGWLGGAGDAESAGRIVRLQSAMSELTVHAQLMGYFNKVEPRDPHWLR